MGALLPYLVSVLNEKSLNAFSVSVYSINKVSNSQRVGFDGGGGYLPDISDKSFT